MISQFIVDETQIKIGSEFYWLWIAIEPKTQANSSHKTYPRRETC